jgi:nuclease S1
MWKRSACMLFLIVGLLGLLPEQARAWGAEGHRIVCEIAWQRLTPQAREFVTSLLRDEADPVFPRTCTWADEVRGTTHRHTATYHYVNIPAGVAGFDMQRDCGDPARRCIVWAIHHYAGILADASQPYRERNEALKFLAHFVGDLHQPLHTGRPEDRGGNDIRVTFFDETGPEARPFNLHSVWDTSMLRLAGHSWPQSAYLLNAQITPLDLERWQTLDVVGWTNESYHIADGYGYGQLPEDRRIANRYYRPALGYSEVRLQQAGARLAYLLNHAAHGTLRMSDLPI